MNSQRLGDDVETMPNRHQVTDDTCERALAYIRRRAGAEAEVFEQALGLAPYTGHERTSRAGSRVRQVERQPREFLMAAGYVPIEFNGTKG